MGSAGRERWTIRVHRIERKASLKKSRPKCLINWYEQRFLLDRPALKRACIFYFRLDCKAVGMPKPKITWYRNGVPIKHSFEYQLYYDPQGISSLTIAHTELEDFAEYVVEAKNRYGTDTTRAELIQLGEYANTTTHCFEVQKTLVH